MADLESNYEEKIKNLLHDDNVKPSDVFDLFKSVSSYVKKFFLNDDNFYKIISQNELYGYIIKRSSKEIYNYLTNKNVVSFLKKYDYIGTIIENINDKKILKSLILRDDIFSILEEENNYTPLLPFINDEEVRDFLKNKVLPDEIEEFYETKDYDILDEEELLYTIMLVSDDEVIEILKTLRGETLFSIYPEILYSLYYKISKKEELIKSYAFSANVLVKDLDEIIYENKRNINILKIILDNPELFNKIEVGTLLVMLGQNAVEFQDYLKKPDITDRFTNKELDFAVSLAYDNKSYIYFLLSPNIVKEINIVRVFRTLKDKIKKSELDQIFDTVNLSDYKRLLIYSVYDCNVSLEKIEKLVENTLYNHETNEVVEELKEEIKDGEIGKNIDIYKIMSYLTKNPDLEINETYFEIIFGRYFSKMVDSNVVKIANICHAGTRGDSAIILSPKNLSNSFNKSFQIFDTLFHELIHEKQAHELYLDVCDYNRLKQVKEEIIIVRYPKYYNDNYNRISIEVEAFIKGTLEAMKFYFDKTKKIPYLSKCLSNLKSYYISRSLNTRVYNGLKYELEVLFDILHDKNDIKSLIKTYPILKLEYNEDGTKKSLYELFMLYSLNKYNMFQNKSAENIRFYKFYKDLIGDILLENTCSLTKDYLIYLIEKLEKVPDKPLVDVPYEDIYVQKVSAVKDNILPFKKALVKTPF